MKTIIFYGSPMKDSHTMALLKELIDMMQGEVKLIDCYKANVAPCKDCKSCFKKEGCCIDDDMTEIYLDIEDSDAVVIATPMHFGIVSAPMFTVFSRLQSYWSSTFIREQNKSKVKPKLGALIVTTGGKWMNMELLMEGVVNFAFSHMNAVKVGSVYAKETDKIAARDNTEALEGVREIACRLMKQVT